MGRPSLEAVRTAQIVEAAARCISSNGVKGATLEQIASEAGLSRGHVRHYVGNRTSLLDRVVDAAAEPYRSRLAEIAAIEEPASRLDALLDHLYGRDWEPGEDSVLLTALLLGAQQDERLRARMSGIYRQLHRAITAALAKDAAAEQRSTCESVAYSLMCLAYGSSVMGELSVVRRRAPMAREAARALIASLSLDGHRGGK